MRFYPTKIQYKSVCFFLFSMALILGCSKDSDLLLDSVINDDEISSVEEKDTPQVSETEQETSTEEETTTEEAQEDILESRTTSFSPTNDAHFQSGKAYNQSIIRLDEGNRTSYLMFDLSPISAIAGDITSATLQFTIDSDTGSGNISVFKGNSSNWSEDNLSDDNIPQIEVQVGSIIKEYKLGDTELVELNASALSPEISTLILNHKNGNDLAFASKEHPSKIGPKLVITYNVDQGKEEIIIPEEEDTSEETTEEDTTEEDTATNQEPIAVADASPSNGGVPLEVSFSGSNSSDDTGITNFSWDFKDGSTATTPNPTHTYTATGVYEAVLTVTDAEGLTTTDTVTITIGETQNEAPKAIINATPALGEAPLEVTFKGSTSTDDHSISSYSWNFKDGSQTNLADLKHTYNESGTYEAELTVTDENGLSDTKTVTIVVTEPTNAAPIAKTSANTTLGTAPLTVQFTGNTSSDDKGITEYSWDFKDGSNASTANPSHSFTNAGTYVVELTVSDQEGLTHKNAITIRVTEPVAENEAPVARVSANTTSGEASLTVQFTGNQSSDDKAITSYFWTFKDGATSTTANPTHTFTQAGNFSVDLTVTDAEGASGTKSIAINVTDPVSNNTPPGFYVATNGNSSNNGQSPSSPWSLEHAFSNANPGDIIYVKAGNYANKELVLYQSGNINNPIKFIGYTNAPGDLTSNQKSTFTYGESVNSNKMPLLSGSSNTQGIALDLNGSHIEVHNFQITKYQLGINTKGTNVLLKNIIVTKTGEQNNNNSQTGNGIQIYGNNTTLLNSFILNSNGEGLNIKGANNCLVKTLQVYSDNSSNPTGYYILISGNGQNNVIENSTVFRNPSSTLHLGHGITIKDQGSGNIIKGCKAYNTGFEVNFSGVTNNTFENSQIYGRESSFSNQYSSVIAVMNGANYNSFTNIYIEDSSRGIVFHDFDDGFTGAGGDKQEGGHNNTFTNIEINKSKHAVGATSQVVGAAATSQNNKFINCVFKNISEVPLFSYQTVKNTTFNGCSFSNIPSNNFIYEVNGGSFQAAFTNCTFSNVGFSTPN